MPARVIRAASVSTVIVPVPSVRMRSATSRMFAAANG
jgi:hypothetical protein